MCNLYSELRNTKAIADLFRVSSNHAAAIEPKDAIFPGHTAPVVRLAPDGERELLPMSWGFVLLQPRKAPRRVTNTHDDKLDGRFWRPSFVDRRCLVPATSFCEPGDGRPVGVRATWYWFALKGDEPRPMFSFAGVWQRWSGRLGKDGPNLELDVYSIMTTVPNSTTASINPERSPVILTTDEERDAWLQGSLNEARALIRTLDGNRLRIVQASAEKRDLIDGPSGLSGA